MATKGRIYLVTEAGRKAWQDAGVPADYRRMLRFIAPEAHSDVIRGLLGRYPDRLIFEWLGELEELGFVSSKPETPAHDLDFTTTTLKLHELLAEDRERLTEDAKVAHDSLSRQGIYIAVDRVRNRAPLRKPPEKTVILIVEDDPDQLALAKLRVGMSGYATRTAATASALRGMLVNNAPPDLLLLDIILPDGDGLDILAKIRRNPRLALLPIVMLTVKDDPADIERGLALGADGYMTKPYSRASLGDVIGVVLGAL